MTTLTTITASGILSPEEVGPLIIKPLSLKSVALRSTTTINSGQSSLRFPIVNADASAQLVDEGAAIPETQADVSELSVTPVAFKALTTVSNELVADAAVNAAAAETIGSGLVRQFQRKLDAAWLANATLLTPSNSVGTLGLKSLADIQNVDVVGAIVNLDPFLSAISKAEKVGAQLTSFVAGFALVEQISKLKKLQATATVVSNEPILQPGEGDVTQPVARTIFGIPLFAVPDDIIDPGVVWGISRADSFTVIRSDVTVEANPYSAFNRDSLQIRGVLRVNFGFPNQPSIVKITSTPDGS